MNVSLLRFHPLELVAGPGGLKGLLGLFGIVAHRGQGQRPAFNLEKGPDNLAASFLREPALKDLPEGMIRGLAYLQSLPKRQKPLSHNDAEAALNALEDIIQGARAQLRTKNDWIRTYGEVQEADDPLVAHAKKEVFPRVWDASRKPPDAISELLVVDDQGLVHNGDADAAPGNATRVQTADAQSGVFAQLHDPGVVETRRHGLRGRPARPAGVADEQAEPHQLPGTHQVGPGRHVDPGGEVARGDVAERVVPPATGEEDAIGAPAHGPDVPEAHGRQEGGEGPGGGQEPVVDGLLRVPLVPEHGEGVGRLLCLDATRTGDITATGVLWSYSDIKLSISTASITPDGLLFIADFSGFLYCLDAEGGGVHWIHDMKAHMWGSTLVADGKVYLGDEDGDCVILAAGKAKKVLSETNLGSPVYATPIVANGVFYIASRTTLFAVKCEER